jgi:uncharacterized pyridoxal phosphate-containing UPF0001 family protein
MILEAYRAGHRDFGENRVQDLVARRQRLPGDIRWHMIGHLQSNKVKYLAPFVHMIHGVDSLKLLGMINQEAISQKRVIDCLLQLRIATEETNYLPGSVPRSGQLPSFADGAYPNQGSDGNGNLYRK